jgi:hypothetical protein
LNAPPGTQVYRAAGFKPATPSFLNIDEKSLDISMAVEAFGNEKHGHVKPLDYAWSNGVPEMPAAYFFLFRAAGLLGASTTASTC